MDDWVTLIVAIISAVAAFFGGFKFRMRYEKNTLLNSQMANNAGVNIRAVTNSTISVNSANSATRVDEMPSRPAKSDEVIRGLMRRIGKEKISSLLQESKLVAIDSDDKEMFQWIEHELAGYTEDQKGSVLPSFRRINGKFLVQISDLTIHPMKFPFTMGHQIGTIENYIDKLKTGKFLITQKLTVPKDVEHIGGKEVDVELPLDQLEKVILGAQETLSKYLESKILK